MNVYPLRKFAFLVTSLIAFKKLLLLSYLPPDNLVLSLITFTIFYFFFTPPQKIWPSVLQRSECPCFCMHLKKILPTGLAGGGRGEGCEDGVYIKWNGP